MYMNNKLEINREIDNRGNVKYNYISNKTVIHNDERFIYTSKNEIDILEAFKILLKKSKKNLSNELKTVIDDIISQHDINTLVGDTVFNTKTMLAHAIDNDNKEVLEYLLQQGADVNVVGPNQDHILSELLLKKVTIIRIEILNIVLSKLNPQTIKKDDNNFNLYPSKYLVALINNDQLSDKDVSDIYHASRSNIRKELVAKCKRVLAISREEDLPMIIKDIFLF